MFKLRMGKIKPLLKSSGFNQNRWFSLDENKSIVYAHFKTKGFLVLQIQYSYNFKNYV